MAEWEAVAHGVPDRSGINGTDLSALHTLRPPSSSLLISMQLGSRDVERKGIFCQK